MKVTLSGDPGQYERAFLKDYVRVARASQAAIHDAADFVRVAGRANIAAAGLSERWQSGWVVDEGQTPGVQSPNAELTTHHKIPYAVVFETGATIQGKPLLWLPLPSCPPRIDGRRTTPRLYVQLIGPLRFVKGSAHPLLFGVSFGTAAPSPGVTRLTGELHSVGDLRRGAKSGGTSVPLFVGVSSVTVGKRLDLIAICRIAHAELPRLYFSHLENG